MKPKLPPEQKRSIHIATHVTPTEYADIAANAERAGLSVSEFMRRVALGSKIESREAKKEFLDLLKVRGDIGRLGGLIKLAMQQGHGGNWVNIDLQLHRLQKTLTEKIGAL